MSGNALATLVGLIMCAVLVAAGVQHRGGFRANWRWAAIWVVIIVGLALLLPALGWR